MRESECTEFALDDLIEFKELKYDSASTSDASLVDVGSEEARVPSSSEHVNGRVSLSLFGSNPNFGLDSLRPFLGNPVNMLLPVIIDEQVSRMGCF